MLWGSLGAVYRHCGRQGCHCANGAKHGPVFYLTRSEAGRTRNIYVPAQLRKEVAAEVAAYRRYRELGQQIAEANGRRLGLGQVCSLFEPHTEAMRKGKTTKPTEFGKLVKLQEAEKQFVVDYQLYARRPADRSLAMPSWEIHQRICARPPHLLAADRGCWSPRNKQAAPSAGVKRVCIPALGKLSAAQRAEQHQRWFRRGPRVRAGCEGRLSVMKRRDGLARGLYRGPEGMQAGSAGAW